MDGELIEQTLGDDGTLGTSSFFPLASKFLAIHRRTFQTVRSVGVTRSWGTSSGSSASISLANLVGFFPFVTIAYELIRLFDRLQTTKRFRIKSSPEESEISM